MRVANGVDQFRDRASSVVLIRVDLPVLVHGCTLDAILIDVGVRSGVSIFCQNLDVLGINVIDIAGQDVVFLFVGSINAVGHKEDVPDQAQVVIGRAGNREGFYRLGFFRLGFRGLSGLCFGGFGRLGFDRVSFGRFSGVGLLGFGGLGRFANQLPGAFVYMTGNVAKCPPLGFVNTAVVDYLVAAKIDRVFIPGRNTGSVRLRGFGLGFGRFGGFRCFGGLCRFGGLGRAVRVPLPIVYDGVAALILTLPPGAVILTVGMSRSGGFCGLGRLCGRFGGLCLRLGGFFREGFYGFSFFRAGSLYINWGQAWSSALES